MNDYYKKWLKLTKAELVSKLIDATELLYNCEFAICEELRPNGKVCESWFDTHYGCERTHRDVKMEECITCKEETFDANKEFCIKCGSGMNLWSEINE